MTRTQETPVQHQPITIRPARPEFAEGIRFAHLAEVASEGFMHVLFGSNYAEVMARAFLEPDHDTSWQNVRFAESDNEIVGMTLAYTEAAHRQSSIEPQRQAAGRWRLRMRMIELLLAPVMRLSDSMQEGDYYLQFIAVDQARRVAGVGSALMDDLEQQARAVRCTRLSLDVSPGNTIARQFYEQRGWQIDFEWPQLPLIPTLSVRMAKQLTLSTAAQSD